MALIVKVGNVTDLPPEPLKWPQCGNYKFQESSAGNLSIKFENNISLLLKILFSFILLQCV